MTSGFQRVEIEREQDISTGQEHRTPPAATGPSAQHRQHRTENTNAQVKSTGQGTGLTGQARAPDTTHPLKGVVGVRDGPKTSRNRVREGKIEKADRLLASHRVWVETAAAGLVRASVIGDSGEAWIVTHETRWACSCPYPRQFCSHVLAVRLVTDKPNHA